MPPSVLPDKNTMLTPRQKLFDKDFQCKIFWADFGPILGTLKEEKSLENFIRQITAEKFFCEQFFNFADQYLFF